MPFYNFKAPALPVPTTEYSVQQQIAYMNALRLYFNRLDAFNGAVATQLNTETVLNWMDAGNGLWSSN